MFCEYLRKHHYRSNNVYFCGVRLYSFDIMDNFIWVPENYQGNPHKDYRNLRLRANEVLILVTMSKVGIVRY